MHGAADKILLVVWYCTAALMISGAFYLFVTGSSLFAGVRQQAHVALAVEADKGVTYISGTLSDQDVCAKVRVQTYPLDDGARELRFERTQRTLCTETGLTEITFLSSFPGRATEIRATLDGKPLNVREQTL